MSAPAAQAQRHDGVTLFGPARSSGSVAPPADDEQQLGGQPLTLVVELTLIEQRTSHRQRLWSLLAGLSSRLSGALGSSSSGGAGSASASQEDPAADLFALLQPGAALDVAAAGVASAADGDSWRSAVLPADAAELMASLQPLHVRHQHLWQRSHAQNGQRHRHELRSQLGGGIALPGGPPPSPMVLAALDTVFAAASAVALACTLLLAADIWHHGWRPQPRGGSARGSGGHPADALLAVDRPEKQPLLVVVAADEAAAMQHAGCGKQ